MPKRNATSHTLIWIGLVCIIGLAGFPGMAGLQGCETDEGHHENNDASLSDSGALPDGFLDSSVLPDAGSGLDATPDGGESCDSLAEPCVSEFGSLFTRTNGRADGTLIALVRPQDTNCAMFNSDHAVLQLSILGHNQRLVVSIDGIAVHTVTAPLIGRPFEEGWHPDMNLDYPSDLGVSSEDFTQVTMNEAVALLCENLSLGAPVSVYAFCDGDYPSSAHQIHRNDNYPDGAIVVEPDSANPTWLLFRYMDQQF